MPTTPLPITDKKEKPTTLGGKKKKKPFGESSVHTTIWSGKKKHKTFVHHRPQKRKMRKEMEATTTSHQAPGIGKMVARSPVHLEYKGQPEDTKCMLHTSLNESHFVAYL